MKMVFYLWIRHTNDICHEGSHVLVSKFGSFEGVMGVRHYCEWYLGSLRGTLESYVRTRVISCYVNLLKGYHIR